MPQLPRLRFRVERCWLGRFGGRFVDFRDLNGRGTRDGFARDLHRLRPRLVSSCRSWACWSWHPVVRVLVSAGRRRRHPSPVRPQFQLLQRSPLVRPRRKLRRPARPPSAHATRRSMRPALAASAARSSSSSSSRRVFGLHLDQALPIGDRDLVIVGMDFAEGEEAVAVAAIFDEGGLQARLYADNLGKVDVALELSLGRGLDVEVF